MARFTSPLRQLTTTAHPATAEPDENICPIQTHKPTDTWPHTHTHTNTHTHTHTHTHSQIPTENIRYRALQWVLSWDYQRLNNPSEPQVHSKKHMIHNT